MCKNKKSQRVFITLFIVVLLLGMGYGMLQFPFKQLNINCHSLLSKTSNSFTLVDINDEEWDSVYIAGPYNNLEDIDNSLDWKYKRKVSFIASSDTECILFFLRKGELIHYAVIPRKQVDFSLLDDLFLSKKNALYVDNHTVHLKVLN